MYKIIGFVILFKLLSCKNDQHLKNKPKEILKYSVNYNGGEYTKGELISKTHFVYDVNGNKIEESFYFDDKLERTLKYNEKGSLIEIVEPIGNTGLTYRRRYTYKYDDMGKVIAWKVTENEKSSPDTTATLQYDEKNNIIERLYYIHEFERNTITKYLYDELGIKVEENTFSLNRLIGKKVFNQKGKLLEEVHFNSLGDFLYRYRYRYDEKGNLIEYTKFNVDAIEATPIRKELYRYDDRNNKIEETIVDSPYYFNVLNKYDERGNLLETKTYNSDGTLNKKSVGRLPSITDTIFYD